MAERSGTTVLVLVEDPDNPGTYNAVLSQRDCSIDRTATVIDVSSKASNDEKLIQGRRASTITMDAAYVDDDEAWLDLEAQYESDPGAEVKVRITEDGTAVKQANAVIASLSKRHPDNAESTCSCTLRVTGGWGAPS